MKEFLLALLFVTGVTAVASSVTGLTIGRLVSQSSAEVAHDASAALRALGF